MTEHTPGPWDVEPTSDHAAAMRVMDEQEVTVALCYQQPFDSWTAEANARLIAKAPEMLEALRDILPDMQLIASRSGPGPDRRLATIRALITEIDQ